MYSFENENDKASRDFFGYNEGTPWERPNSTGMLKANYNILNYPCPDTNRTVPYF